MIDSNLMREIQQEVEANSLDLAKTVMMSGVQIVPSDILPGGKPILLVPVATYEKLRGETNGS